MSPLADEISGEAQTITTEVFGGAEFVSTTGYREFDHRGGEDVDSSPTTLLHAYDDSDYEQWTQEFRLVGSSFADKLDYVLGFYYQQDEGGLVFDTILDSGFAFGAGILNIPFTDRLFGDFDNEAWALYGQADYHLTDRMTLTAGLRYTREDREMSKLETASSALIPGGEMTVVPLTHASEDFSNLSPMAGINYEWSENLMTYFKVSRVTRAVASM